MLPASCSLADGEGKSTKPSKQPKLHLDESLLCQTIYLGQCQALIGSGLVSEQSLWQEVEYMPVILSKGIIKILSRTILSCALVANLMPHLAYLVPPSYGSSASQSLGCDHKCPQTGYSQTLLHLKVLLN